MIMKKILIALSLLVLAVSPTLAIEATRSAKIGERLEQRQERRQEFKDKLIQIRDEKKRQILERISNQLQFINDKAVKAMLNHLERLQALLEKIKTRKPETNTTNTQTKINEAKTAVEAQADKEYIIEFSGEAGLRVGASTAKTKLRADLKFVKEKVRLARQAVVDLLKTTKEL